MKLYKIIEPRLLKKRGLQPPDRPVWIRPWVPVLKKDRSVRICVEYTAVNKGYNEEDFSYQ